MTKLLRSAAIVGLLVACFTDAWASKIDPALLVPEVRVLIDTSEQKFGESQFNFPRDNRGLALSPDGRYLYLGYNNSRDPNTGANRQGEVRRFDLQNGAYDAFDQRVLGVRGKSIATDYKGRVYLAEGSKVFIYDKNLAPLGSLPSFDMDAGVNSEGIEVRRVGNDIVAFTSNRTAGGGITKWTLGQNDPNDLNNLGLTGAVKDTNFGTNGTALLPGTSLRGLDVDSQGRVWVVDNGTITLGGAFGSQLFRVAADGDTFLAQAFGPNNPLIDVAVNRDAAGDQVLVSGYISRTLSMFDASHFPNPLNFGDSDPSNGHNFAIPWNVLELDEDGQADPPNLVFGALSGIAVLPGRGFFVTNETGQTLPRDPYPGANTYPPAPGTTVPNTSTYGPLGHTPLSPQDLLRDDNEPVLAFLIPVPEPAALAIGVVGLFGFLLYVRRQRHSPTA